MTQTYEEAVLKTVMWWNEKAFHSPMNQDNGDDSDIGKMTFLLMNTNSLEAQKSITKEQEKLFEQKLTELLMNCKEHERILDVDYHPCNFLSQAAKFAQIDTSCFPCKSYTRIDKNNEVFAKHKYGSPAVKI